jgi:glycosyltransferase involved in cell wall biosynthesis
MDEASVCRAESVDAARPKLLVLDTNYSLEGIRKRKIEASITCRDLDGFFEHVWSVHPFATLVTSDEWGPRYGPPETYQLVPRHTIIEGKVGRLRALRAVPPLNFLLSQIGMIADLRRLIRRERISVMRAASPLYIGLFGLILKWLTGVPLVIRVGANHDKVFETTGQPLEPRFTRSRKVEKWIERFVFKRADLVAGANQDNLDFAIANGASPQRSTLFRYGNLVDPEHFVDPADRLIDPAVPRSLGLEPGRYLIYVGRLEPVKQPGDVVQVLAAARRQGHDVKALLAGEGQLRGALREQAEALGVGDALVMPGNVDQQRLAQLFAQAAVVVSPHTGRALSEAALAAAAIVAYDVDWQGELIETGRTGILVQHRDVDGMAKAVIGLLSDKKLREKLGRAVRERTLELLDPVALNEHERQAYRALLGMPVRPASNSE